MIIITGDTHMDIDYHKLHRKNFDRKIYRNITEEDYLIICGDAGVVWDDSNRNKRFINYLSNKKWTTLFVDGNHENHEALENLPVEIWNGGKIHRINDKIIHLMRGQVFTIEGLKFFTMGGANSVDKAYRTEGIDWWRREIPSYAECEEALNNLEKHNWTVDYILTHTLPQSILEELIPFYDKDPTSIFLEEVKQRTKYKHWYFGHIHEDMKIDDKHMALFNNRVFLNLREEA
jgi:DNA repair exonuclease SbcCD nuclease subunit